MENEISAHDAVTILRGALVSAECAIKGREHTGFITKALVATEHIAAQSEALAGKDAIIAKFGELAAAYRTEVDKKAERITELETECESLSALANRLDTVLAEYESNPAQQPGERSDLHAAIMNLPCKPLIPDTGLDPVMAHKIGHRDARHAAAELVAAAEGDAIAAARPSAGQDGSDK